MAEQWEYTAVNGTNLTAELNRLGAQGWEAYGVVTTEYRVSDINHGTNADFIVGWRGSNYTILLKRRKQS